MPSHLLKRGPEAFEDGTPSFTALAALAGGFDLLESVGLDAITRHVRELTDLLLRELLDMCHSNGRPVVQLYGPRSTTERGGTVTFNVLGADGRVVPYWLVEAKAREACVSLRGGCFCNPGAAEHAFGLPATEAACLAAWRDQNFTAKAT